jgi:iron uptake system component EfeO
MMSLPAPVPHRHRPALVTAALAASTLALAGCGSGGAASAPGSQAGGPGVVEVAADDGQCQPAVDSAPSGRTTFALHNSGTRVTEMYIYAAGDRVLGEVENVGPATTRDLVVDLPAGDFEVACRPGMGVVSIRSPLKVTGAAAPAQPLPASSPRR